MGRPLAPDQPPWEMHVIEGLEGGRVGLIAKIHHAVIDGVAGVQLMAQLLDLSQEGRAGDRPCPPWLPAACRRSAAWWPPPCPACSRARCEPSGPSREVGRTALRLARCAVDAEHGAVVDPALCAAEPFETPLGATRSVSLRRLSLRDVRR